MKNKLTALLVAFVLFTINAHAQKQTKEDKALEKEWKKKMEEMKPLEYKQMVEEYTSLKTDANGLKTKVGDLESSLASKTAEVDQLKAQVAELQKKAAEEVESNVTRTGPKATAAAAKGVVFKVQIGAFRNKDLSKYFENNPNFSGDVDADGTKKYTIGYFGEYWEADNFKKYLREMGVKDAWIVPYKNGQRVNIKDVLEGAI